MYVEPSYIQWYVLCMYHVLRNKAIRLRKKGYSYNLIKNRVPVSKSTLTNWLKDIPFTPNKIVRERVTKNLLRFVLHRKKLRLQSLKIIKKEMKRRISSVSERDLFMFGLGVYLGEGTKSFSCMRIINADPRVIYPFCGFKRFLTCPKTILSCVFSSILTLISQKFSTIGQKQLD